MNIKRRNVKNNGKQNSNFQNFSPKFLPLPEVEAQRHKCQIILFGDEEHSKFLPKNLIKILQFLKKSNSKFTYLFTSTESIHFGNMSTMFLLRSLLITSTTSCSVGIHYNHDLFHKNIQKAEYFFKNLENLSKRFVIFTSQLLNRY